MRAQRSSLVAMLIAGMLVLPAPAARAIPIQWTLTDVLFEDGGTATGSFIYDADTDAFSSISITTTAGSLSSGGGYAAGIFGSDSDVAMVPFAPGDLTASSVFQLIFQFPLSNAGGTVFLIDPFFPAASSFEATCLNAGCTSMDFGRLVIDGGLVGTPVATVVPLPAAAWLFASGLSLLGFTRRLAST